VPLSPLAADGSFVSKPGDFPAGFRGALAAKLGGEAIEATVLVR
jgi:hypothetical protein